MAEKKANLKEMTWGERISYIWDYYKFWIIGVIVGVIVIVSTVRSIAGAKNEVAAVVLVNASTDCVEEVDMTDFLTGNGYDPADDEVTVNTAYFLDLDSTNTTGMYSLQSLQTLIAAGGVDILGADEEVYEFLGKNGAAADLSQYLSAEELKQYEDQDAIYYITDKDTGDTYPAGIVLQDNSWITENGYYKDGCVIGIINGSTRAEAAYELFQYILD